MKVISRWLGALMCFLAVLLTYSAAPPFSADAAEDVSLISLEAKDETLEGVLAKIAKDAGYRILLSKEWANTPITIKLNNETLKSALSRVLRGLNYVIIWDEAKKEISFFLCHPGKCSGVMWDVSLSGRQTKFGQATSTIAEP